MRKAKPASTAHHSAPEIESPAVAVIAGGYWGKNLVRNFYNLHSLKLVCDKDETIFSNSHRLNLGKIRREENIPWSFAPHDISMILALAEEELETLITTGGNYLHRKIADVITTHLNFSSGLQAHIFVSWLHPYKEQKLVVVGERKMAVFDDTNPWEDKLLLYPHQLN